MRECGGDGVCIIMAPSPFPNTEIIFLKREAKCMPVHTEKGLRIAMLGDGDIIGTTKKNHVESGLLAA